MRTTSPAIFTVPLGRPFLRALADALLEGDLPHAGGKPPSPIELSRMTLLLPTRRAARALGDAFLASSGGRALLLPRIRPIAEGDDDLALLAPPPDAGLGAGLDVPPAVSEIERRLVLTQLVLGWSAALRQGHVSATETVAAAGASTPAQAANLAHELAGLMDMVETEGVSLAGLDKLVPEDFAAHWADTLNFLKIVIEMWPAYLDEQGKLGPATRRNQIIIAEAKRIARGIPGGPVIVAGVTGSIPATVALMRAVANRQDGAIVLPAFDQGLTAADCATIAKHHPEHPQFGLAKLLERLELAPEHVQVLKGTPSAGHLPKRQWLIAEAMRPAPSLEAWQHVASTTNAASLTDATLGMSLIEAATPDDEAETVALILREAVQTQKRTAALVSPDRLLARRVVNRLETMGLTVDDSAGRPLAKTPPGAFLVLVAEAFAQDFAPVPLMALLKHPLTRMGRDVPAIRRAARTIELTAFRTPYLGRGLAGVAKALDVAAEDNATGARRHRAVRRVRPEDFATARQLVADLVAAYAPLQALASATTANLKAWAAAHAQCAEALATLPSGTDAQTTTAESQPSPLWDGDGGEAAHSFFNEVLDEKLSAPDLSAADYPEFYRGLTAGISVRPRVPAHPRIAIWGPFEARLQQPDVIVLGALNDGTWPGAADPGAWLNRPMRSELGLPLPEEKIGYAAHDFTAALGAERVYLTRATKMDGVPTVPSRWLMRLVALLDGAGAKDKTSARALLQPKEPWLAWARARDMAEKAPTLQAPAPKPPLDWRPRKLPVTAIEKWIANPYTIYAQHILQLEALDHIGGVPGAALKGQIIHSALHKFAERFPSKLPENAAQELLDDARRAMEAYAANPRVAAFWLPRFERFAHWFATNESKRRTGIDKVIAEVTGKTILAAPGGPFELSARADRMDLAATHLSITDYKTGRAPSDKRVNSGSAPQLPLEAAIALAGGFEGVKQPAIGTLSYIRVSGGEPPGEDRTVKTDDPAALAKSVCEGLERLIADFDKPETPYGAVRRHAFADSYDFDDYAHLARVAEWSAGDSSNGEG